jgi:hypothetical protein
MDEFAAVFEDSEVRSQKSEVRKDLV